MIETKYRTDAFDDAIEATAYIARVDVTHGELRLPPRVREHLADGDVVVHLLRGEDDVAVHTAQLTATSKLVGINWPEDVTAGTSLVVMCPRGGASHDIGVLLPELQPTVTFLEPEPVDEPVRTPVSDEDLAAITGALTAVADAAYPAEATLPGPAEYEFPPATGQVNPDIDLWASPPTWPGEAELAAGEVTEQFTAALVPATPDVTADVEPGTVFSAALVAVRTPPRRAGWLERRVRLLARLVLEESRSATRVAMAAASVLVLTGVGLAYLVLAVTR